MKTLSILITDDIAENRAYIAQLLLSVINNAQTEMARDGKAAVDAVAAKIKATGTSFDLIIMDYQMPAMNGADATAAIRTVEQAAVPPTKSVIITWSTSKSAPYAHADDWLPKMPQTEDILRVLQENGISNE